MSLLCNETLQSRQYRLIRHVLVAGTFAFGMVAAQHLLVLMRYPTLSGSDAFAISRRLDQQAALSMTISQLFIVVVALVGVLSFIAAERVRMRRVAGVRSHMEGATEPVHARASRVTGTRLRDTMVIRTVGFSGALIVALTAQEMWAGHAMGGVLPMAGLIEGIPLVTALSIILLTATAMAAISVAGLRIIRVLERLRGMLVVTRRGAFRRPLAARRATPRSPRKVYGRSILSRPPPATSRRATV